MILQRHSVGEALNLDSASCLGVGGEARIFVVPNHPEFVAKVYHQPTGEQTHKLKAMLANPPVDPTMARGHISIAWPRELIFENGAGSPCAGFLMPRVNGMAPILEYFNPRARRKRCPLFNTLYLHRAARNVAASIHAIHERGYVIGDVNESNILVADTAMVTLVDTDSFQVHDPSDGTMYRCLVCKPEYTPRELHGKLLPSENRTPEHDLFGLGVLIFQLLMEGTHPFSSVDPSAEEPPPLATRIGLGEYPYHPESRGNLTPPPLAPAYEILHPEIRRLFDRCFFEGHKNPSARPTALQWVEALSLAEIELVACKRNEQHRYGRHLSSCPWCERTARMGGLDPFPTAEAVQNKSHQAPSQVVQKALPTAGAVRAKPAPPSPPPRAPKPKRPQIPMVWVGVVGAWMLAVVFQSWGFGAVAAALSWIGAGVDRRRGSGKHISALAVRLALLTTIIHLCVFGLLQINFRALSQTAGTLASQLVGVISKVTKRSAKAGRNSQSGAGGSSQYAAGQPQNPATIEPNTDHVETPAKGSEQPAVPKPPTPVAPPPPLPSLLDGCFTNSMGMAFVPVPGSSLLFAVWETRSAEYEAFQRTVLPQPKPSAATDPALPASNMKWEEAQLFCQWLTAKERQEGLLSASDTYRLPTDREWLSALGCFSGAFSNSFPWGPQWPWGSRALPPHGSGNFEGKTDGHQSAAPAGSYVANEFGIFDMAGNVWEWCSDSQNPAMPVVCGGSFKVTPRRDRLNMQSLRRPGKPDDDVGFRVVLERASTAAWAGVIASDTSRYLLAPPAANRRWMNGLGMRFAPVPGTSVLASIWETRRRDYAVFRAPPSLRIGQDPDHPVAKISWHEANEFCAWLTARERSERRILPHQRYRLPKDVEWSRAVGISEEEGVTPLARHDHRSDHGYPWGVTRGSLPEGVGNYRCWDATSFTLAVGSYPPNPLGFYDLGGNVWEWCLDDMSKDRAVLRGGSFVEPLDGDRLDPLLSAYRGDDIRDHHAENNGFRIVLDLEPPK